MNKPKRPSLDAQENGVNPRDPGPRATPDESAQAWAEVMAAMQAIEHLNLPFAAKHIGKLNLSDEAIALGFFALDVRKKSEAKQFGEKGGRPSEKPTNFELKKQFDLHRACGSDRIARANLVKELCKTTGAASRTVRGWLKIAGI